MSLLPESGKPIDLDRTLIKDASDAGIVIKWLDDLIVDMQHQILQHLTSSNLDLDWLASVRAALRATLKTRFRVAETKAAFERLGDNAFIEIASSVMGAEKTEEVWDLVGKRLRGGKVMA